jgi:indole-3-glycerol phosphate synthase
MHSILKQIIESKKGEIASRKKILSLEELKSKAGNDDKRSFFDAVAKKGPVNLVAEIKKASPSNGILRKKFDPKSIAKEYSKSGVAAISVLTEETYFHGWVEYLRSVKKNSTLPVLRKDFIVDEYQVYESSYYGADAMLLIASIVNVEKLKSLAALAKELSLEVLVEVHDKEDLAKALKTGARVIGLNNRNLHDFKVDLSVSKKLIPSIPPEKVIIVESGINSREVVERYIEHGVNTFLVGEALMRSENINGKISELIGENNEN